MESSSKQGDRFARMLLDVQSRNLRHGRISATGRFRGLTERYQDHPSESRFQGELGSDVAFGVGSRGAVRAMVRIEGRTYPDTVARNYRRWTGSIGWSGRLRDGLVSVTGGYRGLDYRRTERFDRSSKNLRIDYFRKPHRRVEAGVGTIFEWADYGRQSVKLPLGGGQGPYLGADQRDRGRAIRLDLRYQRAWLWELGLAWESVRSNSIGYSVGRRSLEFATSGWLPGDLLVQLRGRTEATSYHDHGIEDVYVPRTGEDLESGQDNNSILLLIQRRLSRSFGFEGRCGWFRNESLLIGFYYEKLITSLAITWTSGDPSVF